MTSFLAPLMDGDETIPETRQWPRTWLTIRHVNQAGQLSRYSRWQITTNCEDMIHNRRNRSEHATQQRPSLDQTGCLSTRGWQRPGQPPRPAAGQNDRCCILPSID
jgi:hypothetical protein